MFVLETTPGRTCIIDGEQFLFFSGYSYLGMNHVKKFKNLVEEGIKKYGILYPSSRISNTRLDLYEKFERRLSKLTGKEDTVSFSSGYLAGNTIADILSSHKNIFVAPGTHPAIGIKTEQKSKPNNFPDWTSEVVSIINASPEAEFVLASDSVDVLKGEVHDFSFLKNIDTTKKITLLIDDSHGIGILGSNGEGIVAELPARNNIEYIICYSLSKAFNIEGGAVSCSKVWAEKLRHHPNYAGSTAINPSLIYAFMKSTHRYASQRKKLLRNIEYAKKHLPEHILKQQFDLPIFICNKEAAEETYFKKGIIISSFGYPDPSSEKINRIVINALHRKKDIQRLCRVH
jgi:8-amino-7-oxononanoate synthase